jgi:hypothetical protein
MQRANQSQRKEDRSQLNGAKDCVRGERAKVFGDPDPRMSCCQLTTVSFVEGHVPLTQ